MSKSGWAKLAEQANTNKPEVSHSAVVDILCAVLGVRFEPDDSGTMGLNDLIEKSGFSEEVILKVSQNLDAVFDTELLPPETPDIGSIFGIEFKTSGFGVNGDPIMTTADIAKETGLSFGEVNDRIAASGLLLTDVAELPAIH